jgi:hypothetical protein
MMWQLQRNKRYFSCPQGTYSLIFLFTIFLALGFFNLGLVLARQALYHMSHIHLQSFLL